ncbi:effector-associated constant component EACC1 [Nocardia grenadensis]|uniref:effector-associated constant component EACC1 n=1 Tax=Nocardia grenadensis TaxID=931537 RepID=UPI003D72BE42
MSVSGGSVDVSISVSAASDSAAEVRSLFRWLQREEDLPNPAFTPAAPGPEDMGGLSDALVVVLGSGTGVVLARSLSVWVRHRTADVKVTIRGQKGTVELDGKRVRDPLAVVEALREAAGEL